MGKWWLVKFISTLNWDGTDYRLQITIYWSHIAYLHALF